MMSYRYLWFSVILCCTLGFQAHSESLKTPSQRRDWSRLKNTKVLNMRNVLEDKTLLRGALLKTPYALHKATYGQFPSTSPTVCALRFTSRTRDTYELKTFKTTLDAQNEGYQITHTGACGACSSLKDLHTYLTKPNLTTPVRSCASQWFGTRRSLKQCLVKEWVSPRGARMHGRIT